MLDVLLKGLVALNQVGVLLVALVVAGIGAMLLGSAIYWRMRAIRVEGTLIGVRGGSSTFRSVYRYALPSGRSVEATSDQGSSSLRGRETGATVPLLVIPTHPERVEEARSHVWTWIGFGLLAGGAGLFHFAVTTWPVGQMTWIAGTALLAYTGIKIYRAVRSSTPNATPLRSPIDDAPLKQIETLQAQTQHQAGEARQAAQMHRWAPLLLALAVGFVIVSGVLGSSLFALEASGIRSAGVVQSIETSGFSSQDVTYYPHVAFTAPDGRQVGFRDRIGSNPQSHRIGDRVTVLYRPGNLGSAIIDRGIWNWLPPVLLFLFGALLAFLSLRSLKTPLTAG